LLDRLNKSFIFLISNINIIRIIIVIIIALKVVTVIEFMSFNPILANIVEKAANTAPSKAYINRLGIETIFHLNP